jgi:4-hydroxy-tetrahydrodipicolinate reductase
MKIGIVGCAGRMGRMLIDAVLATKGCTLVGGTEQPGHAALGQDLGAFAGAKAVGAKIGDDPEALFVKADAVIDFTAPGAAAQHARLAAAHKVALVIGTTGLGPAHLGALDDAGRKTVVVRSANFSVGVNLLLGLTRRAAEILGPSYDIEIVEMHHRHKVDAPSGTALALGEAAAEGRGVALDKVAQRARDGHTGPRRPGDIGFATLRGGDVVGEHAVIFATEGERLEFGHKAASRAIFAAGAVRAALWTKGRKPGLYSMRDVLGFA